MKQVLVITCLGERFGTNCPSVYLKILSKSSKSPEPNTWLLVNHTKPTNTLYWNQYLLTTSNYKSTSGQLQNSTVNGAMSITINRVINILIALNLRIVLNLNCGPELWSWTVVLNCDPKLWSWIMVLNCGPELWSWIMVLNCDPELWSWIVVLNCGPELWSWIVILNCGPELRHFIISKVFTRKTDKEFTKANIKNKCRIQRKTWNISYL